MMTFGKITKYIDDGKSHPFVVYMILNKINGKFYLGMTKKGIRERSWVHLSTSRSGRNESQVIYRAMRKHGEDNFKFLTIKECDSYSDAMASEMAYIEFLKPAYNMTNGGEGLTGFKHSQSSKEKMSLAKKGKPGLWSRIPMPQDVRDRLAAARREEKGLPRSEKSKAASDVLAKIGNAARRRAVICINTGVEYSSLTLAGAAYSLTSGQITRLCKLGCSTRKGLRFAYRDAK